MVGVDPDPKALARARMKAARAGLELTFEEVFGGELPHAQGSFDRVLSSLVLHHLTHDEKLEALREVRRVLAPSGALHVLDFGPPRNALERGLMHFFHRSERLADNLAGRIPALAHQAGFAEARETARLPRCSAASRCSRPRFSPHRAERRAERRTS